MADVLIIGGAGFVGKHIAKALGHAGADVKIADIVASRPFENVDYGYCDVTDFYHCVSMIAREQPKLIYHLAAQPLVETAKYHPFDTMEVNVRGAYNVLEAIRQVGGPTAIVWFSTDKVYGEQVISSVSEESSLLGKDHPYNASKLVGDILAQNYAESFELPIVIIRSGNIYGEADYHWDRLVPGTIKLLLQGKRPVLRSNGNLKRDYIYVDDVVRGCRLAHQALVRGEITPGTVFNFGSEKCYTPIEIVDELITISKHVDLTPIIENRVQDELQYQHMDYSFATKRLGWKPEVGLTFGLETTYHWYESRYKESKYDKRS